MSKRKCIGLFLMLFSLGSLNGVAQEIAFSDESYEQALKQAKQEKKPVFIFMPPGAGRVNVSPKRCSRILR